MRLGVFGGSFDPVHVGHLAIAEAARASERLDEVVFVPARRNPLKDEEPEASAEDRYEMLRRALAKVDGMRTSRLELERPSPSYTVDTLRALAEPRRELFLILGADALAELARWREPAEVLRLATLLVAKRPGTSADVSALARLGPGVARVRFLESLLVDLSARELRAHARAGGSLRYLVPDPAWRYAAERGLYRQRRDAHA